VRRKNVDAEELIPGFYRETTRSLI